jgi:hypothetical protein
MRIFCREDIRRRDFILLIATFHQPVFFLTEPSGCPMMKFHLGTVPDGRQCCHPGFEDVAT